MNRPIFRPGLDPTLGELLGFLAWLVVVIASMIAMARAPLFHLFFWPTLWLYDLGRGCHPRTTPDLDEIVDRRLVRNEKTLWDRELDG